MKHRSGIWLVVAAMGLSLVMFASPASAKFQKAGEKLFFDVLDLDINAASAIVPTEYSAYAIVHTGGTNLPVIYVITNNFKGKTFVLGAFRCDNEFRVLKSHTNGMRNIRCVRNDLGQRKTTTLIYNGKGLYVEQF